MFVCSSSALREKLQYSNAVKFLGVSIMLVHVNVHKDAYNEHCIHLSVFIGLLYSLIPKPSQYFLTYLQSNYAYLGLYPPYIHRQ